ncbi:MAG: hypothetical protein RMM31_11625 [Anaerolineae bacterium]|nr:hypothetical protein [Thermoflexales bacterium]MDW8396880.1 hypothetical protein [Anaerolineae bacterium]
MGAALRAAGLSRPQAHPLRGVQRTDKGYGLVLCKTLANEIA